jgi:hypothetical protein
MDTESKQLLARKIASVEKPTYEITFLVERQFENENVSQREFPKLTHSHNNSKVSNNRKDPSFSTQQ